MAKTKVGLEGEAGFEAVEEKNDTAAEEAIAEETAPGSTKKNEPVEDIRKHTDEALRREYGEICDALLKKAKEGNIAAARLLVYFRENFSNPEKAKQPGKTLSEMLLDELKRRQDAREAAMQEQNTKANEAEGEGVKSGGDAERG